MRKKIKGTVRKTVTLVVHIAPPIHVTVEVWIKPGMPNWKILKIAKAKLGLVDEDFAGLVSVED
jgi:hypothetical protein